MFSDHHPKLGSTVVNSDVLGGLGYAIAGLRSSSDHYDGSLGSLMMDSSANNYGLLYTDWLNNAEQDDMGRDGGDVTSLPVIIEGNGILQDDFWNELLPNTPIGQATNPQLLQLPHMAPAPINLKEKVAESGDGAAAGMDMNAASTSLHDIGSYDGEHRDGGMPFGMSNQLDHVFDVGMNIPHGVQSTSAMQSSSLDPFTDTGDILGDDEADFILSGGSCSANIEAASSEESKPLANNSTLNPFMEEDTKPIFSTLNVQTTVTDHKSTLQQDQTKRNSGHSTDTKRKHQDQQAAAPGSGSTAGTHPKGRSGHSNSSSQAAKESRWAEQLLSNCASAIASRNIVRTQHLMWVLNDLASLAGDANQRLAAFGLKALFSKITGSVAAQSAHHRHPPAAASTTAKSLNHALLKFHEVNPLHQFVYTLTNAILIESLDSKPRVHVIDIGISQGTQWPTFLEAMATRSGGAPELLRLTIVDDPHGTPFRSAENPSNNSQPGHSGPAAAAALKAKLERFAKVIGINLQLQTIAVPLDDLTAESLSLRDDETLAICAQFRLHRLRETTEQSTEQDTSSGNSETKLSARDRILRLLRDLKAEVMVMNENDADQLAGEFMERFRNVTEHHWRFLDSMSASFKGRDCEERQMIEQELAMALLNNVACEGWARVERNDCHEGWCRRMRGAGFRSVPPSEDAVETVRVLLRKYDSNWDFTLHDHCAVLRWKQQPMTFCSAWK